MAGLALKENGFRSRKIHTDNVQNGHQKGFDDNLRSGNLQNGHQMGLEVATTARAITFAEHLEALAANYARMEAELHTWKEECDRLRQFCSSASNGALDGRFAQFNASLEQASIGEMHIAPYVLEEDLKQAHARRGVISLDDPVLFGEEASPPPACFRDGCFAPKCSKEFLRLPKAFAKSSCKPALLDEIDSDFPQQPLPSERTEVRFRKKKGGFRPEEVDIADEYPMPPSSHSPRSLKSPRSCLKSPKAGKSPRVAIAEVTSLTPTAVKQVSTIGPGTPKQAEAEKQSPRQWGGLPTPPSPLIPTQREQSLDRNDSPFGFDRSTSANWQVSLQSPSESASNSRTKSELERASPVNQLSHSLDSRYSSAVGGEGFVGGAVTDSLPIKPLREMVLSGQNPRVSSMPPPVGVRASNMADDEPVGWFARLDLWMRAQAYNVLKHTMFDGFIGFVICLDGLLLGLEAQNDLRQFLTSDAILKISGIVFKVVFLFELLLRFYAFGVKGAYSNSWIRFDCLLVVCSALDVVMLSVVRAGEDVVTSIVIVRVFRLARLVRAARLMVQFRELWLLISGLRASFGTVMWTFLLLFLISYTFAVLGMEVIAPRDLQRNTPFKAVASEKFGGLMEAMLTLLQVVTLDSIAAIYRPLILDSDGMPFFCTCYFVTFILFVSVALMNLVTAVMVEGSMQQADADREAMAALEEKRKKNLMPKLREMFEALDEDKSGEVSLDEIESAPKELTDQLRAITKVDDLTEIFHLLDDDDSGSVLIDEFLDGILKGSSGDVLQKLQMQRIMKQMNQLRAENAGVQKQLSSRNLDVVEFGAA
eukprot:TRINITY_DN8848_c0_g1_i3.p1 TRINITY_DN8848_c0_g1~~TRINITY_DN8848_c0_g1_i3.p1  ORF type:complete len:849 (+),score=154.29 TRINITY_DN8848_c0_g1_i3:86-2548(+)